MHPKDAIWQFYETLVGEDGKLVQYLTNKTNKCVWCIPCLDKYMALKHTAETTSIGCHEPGPSQARSKAVLRAEAKKPELATLATNWKEKALVLFTNGAPSGVVPICSKVDTMRSHSRRCPHTTDASYRREAQLCELLQPDGPALSTAS
ncbi:hypothetical protein GSI_02409 [Ganoderma sinense ZZ0214-1]|uniref:Uncharacterized protein n=1 Tax=Ganoderma sinense ZZ0214-1 TaxID=1077348 RepID=A0A2G8SPI4_9APHY|nr:hypothetical protein GSI_02409 [Ganoderma sinense ZZ0214-1]